MILMDRTSDENGINFIDDLLHRQRVLLCIPPVNMIHVMKHTTQLISTVAFMLREASQTTVIEGCSRRSTFTLHDFVFKQYSLRM